MQAKWTAVYCLMLLLSSHIVHCSQDATFDENWDDLEDLDADDTSSLGNSAAAQISNRNYVKILTDQNAKEIIASREYVFLLGYATWCSRSSALMPEFSKAASTLADSVLFAKLDAVSNSRAAALYNIKGYPTVLFFTNGSYEVYPGGDTEEEIVNWIYKQTGQPASTVLLPEDARGLLRSKSVLVGGFFPEFKGSEYESFIQAAKLEVGTHFIQTTNLEVAKVFNSKLDKAPAIWIQKNEPEHFTAFDGMFTSDEVLNFVEVNKLPLVMQMSSKNSAKINASPLKIQVLLFADAEGIPKIHPFYVEVARHFKGQMLFLEVDYSEEDMAMPLLSMYGLQPTKSIIAGFDYENGHKYLLEKEISIDNLMAFCHGIISKETPYFYKSEPVPAEDKGHLKIVVGKNFESVVFDESKDVFLEVTTPWCSMCESANITFEKLATMFKDVPSLVIAQIDASANEHPQLEVDNYPTFLLYQAGNKNKPVVASSKMKLKSLIQFVKKNADVAFDIPKDEL